MFEKLEKSIILLGKTLRGYLAGKNSDLEGLKITQRDLAEAANVTEVTVRNRYKEFKEKGLERMVD